MQIGIDIRNIGKKRTGDEVVFFNLIKNLALIDAKNNYQLFTDNVNLEILEKIKNDLGIKNKPNFEIISLQTKNKFTWNFWTLPRYLRKNSLDLYLTQYITPFFVPKKIKIITVIHDVSFCVFPKLIKFSDLFFLRILIPFTLRRADKIIAVSKFTRDEIIKYYKVKSEKISYIHNAVADSFLQQNFSQAELNKIKQKYNLPDFFIFYIGTLQPRKNIPVLIKAYARIRKRLPELKLVLAGGRDLNYDQKIDATIQSCALSKEDVIFPGFILEEDKKALMLLAKLFCFPSLYEGFGIPILEAFSVGLPSIISDIPPHREIAGDNALFFMPKNDKELSQKIFELVTEAELRQKISANEINRLKFKT